MSETYKSAIRLGSHVCTVIPTTSHMIERQTTYTRQSDHSSEILLSVTACPSDLTDRAIIEVHVREWAQLFDAMDPSPFREKDLDDNAEEYMVESVKELPRKPSYLLIIHLDQSARHSDEEAVVEDAIQVHFARRSKLMHRDLRRLIRRGVISLGISVTFFSALFAIGQLIGRLMGETTLATLLRQGLLIAGWVAMWRPLEIFLYDWWPILGEKGIYDRLSRIKVQIDYGELATDSEMRAFSESNWADRSMNFKRAIGRDVLDPAQPNNAHIAINPANTIAAQAAPRTRSVSESALALARWENEGGRILTPSSLSTP